MEHGLTLHGIANKRLLCLRVKGIGGRGTTQAAVIVAGIAFH